MNGRDMPDRILSSLHDAMLDPEGWPATSALIDEGCGTRANSLIVSEGDGDDVRVHSAGIYQHGQRRQELEREYFKIYYPVDERIPRLRQLPDSRLTLVKDLYTHEELKSSPAYNEWVHRFGNQNGLNVRLDGPDGTRIVWSLGGCTAPDGWSSTQIKMLERLLPHIRHFVRVRHALANANVLGASVTHLLDSSGIGVIHLDRRGRIVEANDIACGILRRGDGLTDARGFLGAWLPADNTRLQELLATALPPLGGQTVSGSVTVQRISGLPRLLLHVIPVASWSLDAGVRRLAALVLLVDPASQPQVDPELVSAVLGLTTAESRVAVLLTHGLTIRDMAALTGRQENSVRKHLKQTYRKLGISRQAELVRLVLTLGKFSRSGC